MSEDPPAVETEGLVREFGAVRAVDGLDLQVEPGTVYGFLGPNGAGKTTTIRMLTTLLTPTAGEARVMGVSVRDRETVTPHVGYLPETPPLYEELSGREQLAYMADLWDLPAAATDRADELLARFGMAEDAGRRIDGYSTVMKKKLGIVQALLHEPDVLFLDEPTSGLDPRAARTVRETVAELAAEEMTVFLSSHVLGVVEEIADQVGVLADGQLVAEGTPAELVDRVESADDTVEGASLEDAFLEVTHELAPET
jgi:ABC-2 type transport system ATP-binding protein